MIDERMAAFIRSFDSGNTDFLNELEKEALDDRIPVIRPGTQNFLKLILAMIKPEQILEVGCAVGFSALLMSEYAPENCHITTIEKYEKRIPQARRNFKKAGKEEKITLLEGDAADILKQLTGSYDLIFMDAAKAQYINFFPDVYRLMKNGSVLLSDNILQEGEILESRFAVTRRNRTIHSRMREYLYELTHHPGMVTSILPVGDGVAVSVKTEETE